VIFMQSTGITPKGMTGSRKAREATKPCAPQVDGPKTQGGVEFSAHQRSAAMGL
jgi:hypothetical protein